MLVAGAGVDEVAGTVADVELVVVAAVGAPVEFVPAPALDEEDEEDEDEDPALALAPEVGTVNGGAPLVSAVVPPPPPQAVTPAPRARTAAAVATRRPQRAAVQRRSIPTGRREPAAPCASRSTGSR